MKIKRTLAALAFTGAIVSGMNNKVLASLENVANETKLAVPAISSPSVPGKIVRTYAQVDFPAQMAFDNAGNLYVGNYDNDTDNGFVRKITPDGTVSNYGTNGFYDADAIAFDSDGKISGTPGTILVGCGYPGRMYGIKPDQSIETIFSNMDSYNPTHMTWDGLGRLEIIDATSCGMFVSTGQSPVRLFDVPPYGCRMAVRPTTNEIYVSIREEGAEDGRIEIYQSDGTLKNPSFAAGLGTDGGAESVSMAFGPGGIWGNDLYVLTRGELKTFDSKGNSILVGTGFDSQHTDLLFGPDDFLYIADNGASQILQITPEPSSLSLLGLGGLGIFAGKRRKNLHQPS